VTLGQGGRSNRTRGREFQKKKDGRMRAQRSLMTCIFKGEASGREKGEITLWVSGLVWRREVSSHRHRPRNGRKKLKQLNLLSRESRGKIDEGERFPLTRAEEGNQRKGTKRARRKLTAIYKGLLSRESLRSSKKKRTREKKRRKRGEKDKEKRKKRSPKEKKKTGQRGGKKKRTKNKKKTIDKKKSGKEE